MMSRSSLKVIGFLTLAIAAFAADRPSHADDPDLVVLDQGWSQDLREQFYFTPQGSRMMPYIWFKALERPDGEGLFADPAYLQRFGLIPPDSPSVYNPDGFSIGIAVSPGETAAVSYSPDTDGLAAPLRYVGLTCAACHTATVTVEGTPIRIDGGPAHFDFDSFYADLTRAVNATLLDEARFARFADRVLGPGHPMGVAELQLRFAAFQVNLTGDATLRRPLLESGYGRVDALTQILNSLAVRDQSEPANLFPVAVSTSYPPLWLTPDLEFVQWNPVASSPIARNAGEVLGVFGSVDLSASSQTPFRFTALVRDLHALEGWVADLKPPVWDEDLMGPIDRTLAEQGAELFKTHCAGCHNMAPYERTDPEVNYFGKTFIRIGRIDYRKVGTDPHYVESLVTRLIKTNPVTAPLFGGQDVVPAPSFFLRTVGAAVELGMNEAGLTPEEKADYNGYRLRKTASGVPEPYAPPSVTDLKASPLAGVWATGPYLHNGSVPTVYELLSPEDERRTVFWTGGRELDRERLGFVSDDAPGRFRFDTSLPGNGNQGHRFPSSGLDHSQRMAVIEYLKTQ